MIQTWRYKSKSFTLITGPIGHVRNDHVDILHFILKHSRLKRGNSYNVNLGNIET